MAKQGNWNKSFWKALDNLSDDKINDVRQAMLEECGKAREILYVNTPFKYGGLKSSIYSVVVDTPNGVSARIGYTQTPHWDLDPAYPHQDNITNANLMAHLYNTNLKNYDTYAKIDDIQIYFDEFKDNIQNRITAIWKGGN